jgi:cytochrome c oxidase subunit 4
VTASGRPLVLVLVGLLGLTLASWALSHVELGAASVAIALAIAALKASLVVYWFMELPHAALPARVVGLVTLAFIALLCGGTLADVAFR